MDNRYYFAYGSNLNTGYWRDWCRRKGFSPDLLQFRSTAFLPDWELVFDYRSGTWSGGALNLKKRVGQLTAGAVFEVAPGGWEALDAKEGAPHCYGQQSAIAITTDGEAIPVVTYVVRRERRDRTGFVTPTPEYVEVVREGLAKHDLTEGALKAAARGKPVPWDVDGLFVYGTLLRGESRFGLLEPFGLQCALLAATHGRLTDLGAFPGLLIPEGHDHLVRGEFLRLRDIGGALKVLDKVEGFNWFGIADSLYRRDLITVNVGDGRIRRAWTYRLAEKPDNPPMIASGDWREHRGVRESFLTRLVATHAGGDEQALALSLAQRIPFAFWGDPDAVAADLQPLVRAVRADIVSERRMAQASGEWAAIP